MITILVHVKPGSVREAIALQEDGTWLIRIREQPLKGAANEYLIRYLSKEWGVAKRLIRLEKGAGARYKKISLEVPKETFTAIKTRYTK